MWTEITEFRNDVVNEDWWWEEAGWWHDGNANIQLVSLYAVIPNTIATITCVKSYEIKDIQKQGK